MKSTTNVFVISTEYGCDTILNKNKNHGMFCAELMHKRSIRHEELMHIPQEFLVRDTLSHQWTS